MQKNKIAVLTRPQAEARELAARLKKRGIKTYIFPTVEIRKLKISAIDQKILRRFEDFDLIILNSKRAARFFAAQLKSLKISPEQVSKKVKKIIAVGPVTAKEAAKHGFKAEVIAAKSNSKALAAKLKDLQGKKILVPRSAIAPQEFIKNLRAKGAKVRAVKLYIAAAVSAPDPNFNRLIKQEKIGCIVFMSGSSVAGFAGRVKNDILKKAKHLPAICLGGETAAAARQMHFRKILLAPTASSQGILQAIRRLK